MSKKKILKVIDKYRTFLLKKKSEIISDMRNLADIDNDEEKQLEKEKQLFSSTEIDSELEFINEQIEMLDECYHIETQKMSIYESTGYAYYQDNSNNYARYQIEKFLYHIAQASKTDVRIFSISQECPSINHVWEYIENNKDLSVIKIDSEFFDGDFIENDNFYSVINTAKNLFYIHVFVGEDEYRPDIDLIKKKIKFKINYQRPLIVSWGTLGSRTTLIKMANSDNILCSSNKDVNPILSKEPLSKKDFLENLSNKAVFGLPFLCNALHSKIIGQFENNDKILLNATIYHDKEFDGWRIIDYAIYHNDILTVRFLMLHDYDLSIKNSGGYRILEIAAQYSDVEIAQILLSSSSFNLLEFTDNTNYTPLCIAAKYGKVENLNFFIKSGANIYHNNSKAISLAWENRHYNCVLALLEAGSNFPNNFDITALDEENTSSQLIIKFVEKINKFHNLIINGEQSEVINYVVKNKLSRICVNMFNNSALLTSFINKKLSIYAFLKSKGFKLSNNENISMEIDNLDEKDKIVLNNEMIFFFNKPNSSTVIYLLSKSRILQSDDSYFDMVKLIYEQLALIPTIEIILKVIECNTGNLDIIFDFDNNSIQDLDITASATTLGRCDFKVGRIYVGAKVDFKELLGTVAHELTHLVMQILYNNSCEPYLITDLQSKKIFDAVVKTVIKDKEHLDNIVKRAFTKYDEKDWNAELIVRVPHLIAKYGNETGLDIALKQAVDLVNYYNDKILNDCQNYISKNSFMLYTSKSFPIEPKEKQDVILESHCIKNTNFKELMLDNRTAQYKSFFISHDWSTLFIKKFINGHIEEYRHKKTRIQNEYDRQFGIIQKPASKYFI